MDPKCKDTQYKILDWYYGEPGEKNWDSDHLQQCEECRRFYQKLEVMEKGLPREPMTFHPSEDFIRRLEDRVRKEGPPMVIEDKEPGFLKALGIFPAVAFFLLMLVGNLFYFNIGPSFIQVQLGGMVLFPLIIPILGVLERNRQQGRGFYGL